MTIFQSEEYLGFFFQMNNNFEMAIIKLREEDDSRNKNRNKKMKMNEWRKIRIEKISKQKWKENKTERKWNQTKIINKCDWIEN